MLPPSLPYLLSTAYYPLPTIHCHLGLQHGLQHGVELAYFQAYFPALLPAFFFVVFEGSLMQRCRETFLDHLLRLQPAERWV